MIKHENHKKYTCINSVYFATTFFKNQNFTLQNLKHYNVSILNLNSDSRVYFVGNRWRLKTFESESMF